MTIGWKDNYNFGDDTLDEQHKNLFDLARMMLAAEDATAVTGLAAQLYKHTRVHFEYEEQLMREHNYPGLESHIESHNQLLGRLNTLSLGIGAGQLDKEGVKKLMTDWALFHIPLEDARFATYMKSAS